jgi:zinc protease
MRVVLALILLLQSAQSIKPPVEQIVGPYTFREDKDQTTKVILKNGLTVLVREQSAVPLVNITTYVKAGYFNEPDRLTGISHVVEHMFFKGTAKRPVGEIARQTRALGGTLNAYTDYERTVYRTSVPSTNALAALEIQADALWNPAFDGAELAREVEVVLQENNRKLDNPAAVASEKLYATAFTQHRMKRWRIGTPEGLRGLTRDDLFAYYKTHYTPSNVILVVVGDYDRERILNEIVKLYGVVRSADPTPEASVAPLPAAGEQGPGTSPPVSEDAPIEPPQETLRYASQAGPIQQTHIAMGFHTPGLLSPQARALEVLAAALGSGRASRLVRHLRDERNLITAGSAELVGFRDMGVFEIDLRTSAATEAGSAVLAELEWIKLNGVTKEALSRAKTAIAQRYIRGLETLDGIGDTLAYHEALSDWKNSESYLSEIQKVSRDDVVAVARQYLAVRNLSAFEYLPDAQGRTWTAGEFESAVVAKVAALVQTRKNEPPAEELPANAELPDLAAGFSTDLIGTVQRRSIQRGPQVYILEDQRLPLVSFGFFYPGGRLFETEKNAGITELMLRTALRGTRQLDGAGIVRRLENAGASIQIVNEPDFFGYIVDGLPANMPDALAVLIDVLQQPRFDEQELAKEKTLQIAQIRNLRDDNYAYPVSLFMRNLFGDHPYGRTALGSEEVISKLGNTDLRDWFRNNARALVPSIVIVGDTEGTGLVAPLTDALTNEDLSPRDLAALPAARPAQQSGQNVVEVGRQQTAMVYGFSGPAYGSRDRHALEVFANLVSGLGGRFFDTIREKQGLAYTVRTSNFFGAKGGAVFTYTAFSPDREAEVRAALDSEYLRLYKEGFGREELTKAINSAIGAHEIALQTRQSRVLELARGNYGGTGIQQLGRHSELLRAVTPEDIRAILQEYFDPSTRHMGIVRGRSGDRPGIPPK